MRTFLAIALGAMLAAGCTTPPTTSGRPIDIAARLWPGADRPPIIITHTTMGAQLASTNCRTIKLHPRVLDFDDATLAFIIGHEMAHIRLKHCAAPDAQAAAIENEADVVGAQMARAAGFSAWLPRTALGP